MNSVMGPSLWKTYVDNMVEQINNVIIKSVKTVLEELDLEPLLFCSFTSNHHSNILSNVSIRELVVKMG